MVQFLPQVFQKGFGVILKKTTKNFNLELTFVRVKSLHYLKIACYKDKKSFVEIFDLFSPWE